VPLMAVCIIKNKKKTKKQIIIFIFVVIYYIMNMSLIDFHYMITSFNQINTGDALLVSGTSWLARTIQKFQSLEKQNGSHWNHAGMFWWCYDKLMVIEADRLGITCTDFHSYYIHGKSELLCLKPKFPIYGNDYGKFLCKFWGHSKYDYYTLLIAEPVKFLTNNRLWIGRNNLSSYRFICGEFVAFVYKHFHPELFPDVTRISPSELYNSYIFEHQYINKEALL
jgi:hypothetical protein